MKKYAGRPTMETVGKLRRQLLDVAMAADQLCGRTHRLLGGEQLPRAQSRHVAHYGNLGCQI